MRKNTITAAMFAIGLSFSVVGYAQDDSVPPADDAMEEEETLLMLPEQASEQGLANSQFGLDTANSAREQGAEFGRDRASQARGRDKPELPQTREGGMPETPSTSRPGRPER